MKYLYLILSSLIVAYAVVIIFIYFYQRNLLYHPSENNYQDDKIQFSYDEISKELNLPLGTVKAQLFRARESLYNILKNSKDRI